jgi:hypothetical protein
MIVCPACRAENPAGATSCEACGAALRPPIPEPKTEAIEVSEFPSAVSGLFGKTVPAAPGLEADLPLTDRLRPVRDSVLSRAIPDSDPKPPEAADGGQTMVEVGGPKTVLGSGRSGTRIGPKALSGPQPVPQSRPLDPPTYPRLRVIRGERTDAPPFRLLEGKNYIGRFIDKPVDIDLSGQEPPDQVWASRQHAVVTVERGAMTVEDLNSLNGTFVNRARIHPGQAKKLVAGDVIQIGMVQMRVEV